MEDPVVDSLRQRLAATTTPRERIPLLDEISFRVRFSNPHEAFRMAVEELRLAKGLKDNRWTARSLQRLSDYYELVAKNRMAARCLKKALHYLADVPAEETQKATAERAYIYRHIARIMTMQGNLATALKALNRSLKLAYESVAGEEIGATLMVLGGVYRRMGEYSSAIERIVEAREINREMNNPPGVAWAQQEIASIMADMGLLDDALEMFTRSADVLRLQGNKADMGVCYTSIANVHAQRGDLQKARDYYFMGLDIQRVLGDRGEEAEILNQIAQSYLKQKQPLLAREYLADAARAYNSCGMKAGVVSCLAQLGRLHMDQGNHQRALALLTKALERSVKLKFGVMERDIRRSLAELHEQLGQPEQSLGYYKEYLALKERIESREVQRLAAAFRAKDDVEALQAEREQYRAKSLRLEEVVEEKSKEIASLALHLVRKDELLDELRSRMTSVRGIDAGSGTETAGMLRALKDDAHQDASWKTFDLQLRNLSPGFTLMLVARYPDLTPTELKICSLLKIGMVNKDISVLLNISIRTIDAHRQNIRKKLHLPNSTNLGSFLAGL